MPSTSSSKPTLGLLTILCFVSLALLLDLLKDLLFLIDIIPIGGMAIGELATYVVSFFEPFLFVGLWMAGGYRGKSAAVSFIFTFGAVLIDFTPFLDHLPATTAAVVTVIIRSRMNDKAEQLRRAKKTALIEKNHTEQAHKNQHAQAAKQRALNMREPAMATSIAVAQADTPSTRTTSPSANLPSARRPLPDGRSNANPSVKRPSAQDSFSRAA